MIRHLLNTWDLLFPRPAGTAWVDHARPRVNPRRVS